MIYNQHKLNVIHIKTNIHIYINVLMEHCNVISINGNIQIGKSFKLYNMTKSLSKQQCRLTNMKQVYIFHYIKS